MADALPASTLNEVKYYLMVRPCGGCGKGSWELDESAQIVGDGEGAIDELRTGATCKACGHRETFAFAIDHQLPPEGPAADLINPGDAPSRLIDLAQWLSLFYLLLEKATSQSLPAETRRLSYQASLCLAEALKFYTDNELPPESAFFGEATLESFRRHPEKFARQRLRDMQSRLPSKPKMTRRLERDRRVATRKWWQFWRR